MDNGYVWAARRKEKEEIKEQIENAERQIGEKGISEGKLKNIRRKQYWDE